LISLVNIIRIDIEESKPSSLEALRGILRGYGEKFKLRHILREGKKIGVQVLIGEGVLPGPKRVYPIST